MSIALEKNIILIADPRILAIEIGDNHEPLVDVKNQNEIWIFSGNTQQY